MELYLIVFCLEYIRVAGLGLLGENEKVADIFKTGQEEGLEKDAWRRMAQVREEHRGKDRRTPTI